MTETSPWSQLKYRHLRNALLYVTFGMEYEYQMREELKFARKCSLQLGFPLALSVEERIQNVYNTVCMTEKVIGKTDCRKLIKPRRKHYRR